MAAKRSSTPPYDPDGVIPAKRNELRDRFSTWTPRNREETLLQEKKELSANAFAILKHMAFSHRPVAEVADHVKKYIEKIDTITAASRHSTSTSEEPSTSQMPEKTTEEENVESSSSPDIMVVYDGPRVTPLTNPSPTIPACRIAPSPFTNSPSAFGCLSTPASVPPPTPPALAGLPAPVPIGLNLPVLPSSYSDILTYQLMLSYLHLPNALESFSAQSPLASAVPPAIESSSPAPVSVCFSVASSVSPAVEPEDIVQNSYAFMQLLKGQASPTHVAKK